MRLRVATKVAWNAWRLPHGPVRWTTLVRAMRRLGPMRYYELRNTALGWHPTDWFGDSRN